MTEFFGGWSGNNDDDDEIEESVETVETVTTTTTRSTRKRTVAPEGVYFGLANWVDVTGAVNASDTNQCPKVKAIRGCQRQLFYKSTDAPARQL
ncbi:jg16248 [Pararge aegeria aegeria]|uniref:Jg16248 protein n=1 Tax=Pararge aegeria aegeria TaxID=348720 RepID=A0A8S4RXF6_9NEOP|nr:jg16248 [Pararge aegeria aegeria]